MSSSLEGSELMELVHRYYPAGIYTTDSRHGAQQEARELRKLRDAAQQESGAWNALLQRISEELPGCSLWELPYLLYDPCRCVRVSLEGSAGGASAQKAVVLLVSILAPVHHLYASFQRIESQEVVEQKLWHPPLPQEYQTVEARLSALVQSALGTSRLSNETLFLPVPDIQVGNLELGRAQLIHCLFTDRLW
jgi:hypothetical protein